MYIIGQEIAYSIATSFAPFITCLLCYALCLFLGAWAVRGWGPALLTIPITWEIVTGILSLLKSIAYAVWAPFIVLFLGLANIWDACCCMADSSVGSWVNYSPRLYGIMRDTGALATFWPGLEITPEMYAKDTKRRSKKAS